MKIIFCDDNKSFLKMLVNIMQKYENLYNAEIISFSIDKELMNYCRSNPFDIVYMDIEIGTSNGMDLARTVKIINPKSLIIYMSSYSSYFAEMVNAEPFRFIPKDTTDICRMEKEFADTLEAAIKRLKGRDIWTYIFNRKQYNIELAKIKYFYSISRRIYIVGDLDWEQNYYYGKLDDVQTELMSKDEQFMRINKKVIVNMAFAGYKGKNKIEINKRVFTVEMKYREDFYSRFKKHWKIYL